MPDLPDRELLLAHHEFPGPFVIKAFGPAADRFRDDVRSAAERVVGERLTISERLTRSGGSVCVTVTLHAESVDDVLAGYRKISAVAQLKLIL
ncbi:MAG: DUF493 family protein [Planctomycetota bacterium]